MSVVVAAFRHGVGLACGPDVGSPGDRERPCLRTERLVGQDNGPGRVPDHVDLRGGRAAPADKTAIRLTKVIVGLSRIAGGFRGGNPRPLG